MLVRNCAYEKLARDDRPRLFTAVRAHVHHPDRGVVKAALDCLCALLGSGIQLSSDLKVETFEHLLKDVVGMTLASNPSSLRSTAFDVISSLLRKDILGHA